MSYRKSTLRTMTPDTRTAARLVGEMESVCRRFDHLIPKIQEHEMATRALQNAKQAGFCLPWLSFERREE